MVKVGDTAGGLTFTRVEKVDPKPKRSGGSSGSSSRIIGWSQGAPPTPEQIEKSSSSGRARQKSAYERRMAEIQAQADAKAKASSEARKMKKEVTIPLTPQQRAFLNQKEEIEQAKKVMQPLSIQSYQGIEKPFGVRDKKIKYYEPKFGSIGYDPLTGMPLSGQTLIETTEFERLKEQERFQPDINLPPEVQVKQKVSEISDRLNRKYQGKVNTGELSVEEATAQFEAEGKQELANLEQDIKFKQKLERSQRFRQEVKKANIPTKTKVLGAVETGVDLGVAFIPGVNVGYYTGKGAYKISKGASKDIYQAEIDPVTGKTFVPLYPGVKKFSPESQEGFAFLGFAGVSALTLPGGIGKQITKIRADELKNVPWTIEGRELIKKGDKTLLRVYGSKTTGQASAEVEALIPIKQTGQGKFLIETGKGTTNVRVVDYTKQIQGYKGSDKLITKSQDFVTAGSGSSSKGFIRTDYGNIKLEDVDLFVTQGEGYVSSGGKSEFFTYGGISEKTDEGFNLISGNLNKARLYPQEGRFSGLFRPTSKGKIITKEISEEGGFKTFQGGGKKSSSEFLEQLYKEQPEIAKLKEASQKVGGFFSNVAERTSGNLISGVATGSKVSSAPLVGGLTLLSPQETVSKSKLGTKSTFIPRSGLDSGNLEKTKSPGGVSFSTSIEQVSNQRPSSKSGFSPISRQGTKQGAVTPTPVQANVGLNLGGVRFPGEAIGRLPLGLPRRPKRGSKVTIPGYNVEVLRESTKNGKWEQINTRPATEKGALSLMAREVDRTISAKGRIVPITQTKKGKKGQTKTLKKFQENQLYKGNGYFEQNRDKFREYKIKKGQKVTTPRQFIEKRKYRADSPFEQSSLQRGRSFTGMIGGANFGASRPQRMPNTSTKKRTSKVGGFPGLW